MVIRVRSFTVANVDSIGFVDRMCFQWAAGRSKCARSRGTSANRALTALDTSSHSLGQSVASPSRRLSGSRHTSSHATLVSPGVGVSWGTCPARWRSGVPNSVAPEPQATPSVSRPRSPAPHPQWPVPGGRIPRGFRSRSTANQLPYSRGSRPRSRPPLWYRQAERRPPPKRRGELSL